MIEAAPMLLYSQLSLCRLFEYDSLGYDSPRDSTPRAVNSAAVLVFGSYTASDKQSHFLLQESHALKCDLDDDSPR